MRHIKQATSRLNNRRTASLDRGILGRDGSADTADHFFASDSGPEACSNDRWSAVPGLPATMIRPAAFMEIYYIDQVELGILTGKLTDPIRGNKPYQTIATDDIGAFVALAFERPTEFIGKNWRSLEAS